MTKKESLRKELNSIYEYCYRNGIPARLEISKNSSIAEYEYEINEMQRIIEEYESNKAAEEYYESHPEEKKAIENKLNELNKQLLDFAESEFDKIKEILKSFIPKNWTFYRISRSYFKIGVPKNESLSIEGRFDTETNQIKLNTYCLGEFNPLSDLKIVKFMNNVIKISKSVNKLEELNKEYTYFYNEYSKILTNIDHNNYLLKNPKF